MNKLVSQDNIIERFNPKLLYEFMTRVNTGVLDTHINNDISQNNIHNISVETET
jgi:hypothetical protein